MIRRNINLDDISTETLDIGFVGEANHIEIAIHSAGFFKDYPDATAVMTVAPPVGEMYPVELEREDYALIWTISTGDVAYAGNGTYQLTFTENEEIIKTVYGSYVVSPSLVPTGEAPDPVQNWIDQAEEELDAFRNMTAEAETLAPGSEATAELTEEDGHKVLSLGLPRGEKGEQGDLNMDQLMAVAVMETVEDQPIAAFPDGANDLPVRSLVVGIEPVQDLHGQESPYPAGGGKNLVGLNTSPGGTIEYSNVTASDHTDDSVKLTSENNTYANMRLYYTLSAGTYTMKYQASVSDNNVGIAIYNGDSILVNPVSPNTEQSFTLAEQTLINIRFFVTLGTATARAVTFSQFQLEKGSSASAWTPYSNVCPISGWTGANVSRAGINIWDEQWELGSLNTSTGQPGESSSKIRTVNYIPVLPNTEYGIVGYALTIYEYGNDKSFIGYTTHSVGTFTTGANTYFIKWTRTATSYANNISINYPATDTQYHPGHVQQIEYEFPASAGIVHGGKLTIHQDGTGVLTVEWARTLVSDLEWTYDNTYTRFSAVVAGIKRATTVRSLLVMSECFESITDGRAIQDIPNMAIYCGSNSSSVFVKDTDESDSTTFIQKYGTTAIVYPLATPATYQLTNQQVIQLLKGVNNVWADTGSVSLEYPADTKLYIDKKVAELQALVLENISNS